MSETETIDDRQCIIFPFTLGATVRILPAKGKLTGTVHAFTAERAVGTAVAVKVQVLCVGSNGDPTWPWFHPDDLDRVEDDRA